MCISDTFPPDNVSAVQITNRCWHIQSGGERVVTQEERGWMRFGTTVTDDPAFGDTAQLEQL